MGTVIVHGQQFDASPCVVLPEENSLVVDKFAALRVDEFPPKVLVLQQIKEVQAHRVFDELRIVRFFPVEQILQVVDECLIFEVASLCNN